LLKQETLPTGWLKREDLYVDDQNSFLNSSENKIEVIDFTDGVRYEYILTQQDLIRACKVLESCPTLAVDTENTGLDAFYSKPLLLQISNTEICYIFPGWKEAGLDFGPVKKLLEKPGLKILFHNAKYDLKFLSYHYGILPLTAFDTQLAERLLTVGISGKKYFSLAELTDKYLGIKMAKDTRKNFIDRDPIANPITEEELLYSARDVLFLPLIFDLQCEYIRQHGLGHAIDLEASVVSVITETELAGVLIDVPKWKSLVKIAEGKLAEVEQEILKCFAPTIHQPTLFGVPTFNLRSHPQLLEALRRLGLIIESTGEEELKKIRDKHPVVKLLVAYRGWEKVISTYGESFLKLIHKKTGRIHANFNQVAADTGRFSSSGPNLQNIPGYDKDDPDEKILNFRSCFIARPGYKLITCDYSQQEMRALADFSGDPILSKVYLEPMEDGTFMDLHSYTASVVFDIPYAKIGKKSRERTIAKVVNFFLVYGGGPSALSEALDITFDEAKGIIDDYFKKFPKIKSWIRKESALAKSNLYSTTASGRKRFYSLPSREDPTFEKILSNIDRQGPNTIIQGSSADVTKMAMVLFRNAAREAGLDARIITVVHDEIVVEARDDQSIAAARLLEKSMDDGWKFYFKRIPMVVDAVTADSWEK
jgi:DNA polymerase-1